MYKKKVVYMFVAQIIFNVFFCRDVLHKYKYCQPNRTVQLRFCNAETAQRNNTSRTAG